MKYLFLLFLQLLFSNALLAQTPQLIVPVGHTGNVSNAIFSNNSQIVATVAEDNTVKLWDVVSGRLLYTLYGHKQRIVSVQFSPDDKYLLSYSFADTLMIVWNVQYGTRQLMVDSSSANIVAPIFSNNSKFLAVAGKTGIDLWDVATAKVVKRMNYHNKAFSFMGFFNNDKNLLAAETYDDHIYLFDVAGSGLNKTVKTEVGQVLSFQFSSDSKALSVRGSAGIEGIDLVSNKIIRVEKNGDELLYGRFQNSGRSYVKLVVYHGYDIKGRDTVYSGQYSFAPSEFDIVTGKSTEIMHDPLEGNINTLSYDENLEHIAILAGNSLVVFEKIDGKYVRSLTREIKNPMDDDWVTVSSHGKYFITAGLFKPAVIYDITGKTISTLEGQVSFGDPQFSDDGKYILTERADRLHQCWNIVQGKFELNCSTDTSYLKKKNFNNKPALLFDSSTNQWTIISDGNEIGLKGYSTSKLRASIIPGKDLLMTYWGDDDSVVRIWNISGEELYHFTQSFNQLPVFNSNGDKVVLMKNNEPELIDRRWANLQKELDGEKVTDTIMPPIYTVRVIDLVGKELFRYADTVDWTLNSKTFFTDNGKHLVLATNNIRIWNTERWNQVLTIDHSCDNASPGVSINSIGDKILISCTNSTSLYEAGSNKLLFSLPGSLNYSSFSEDEKYILTGSVDDRLKIWNASTGKPLYTWFGFQGDDYLVTDEEGHYDGTEAARKALYFNCGDELVELSQLKDQLWVPGLAERIMKNDVINAPKLSDLNICGITPVIKGAKDNKGFHFNITPRKGGIGEVALLVNNVEVNRYKATELKFTAGNYQLNVQMDSVLKYFVGDKENEVTVKAYTKQNGIASRGLSIKQSAEARSAAAPNLFAVMVGVSDYKGDDLDLQYAAKDAVDLSKAIAASAGKLLNTDGRQHVFMYDLTTTTDHYLLPEKKSIQKVLKQIGDKAAANDILLLFFAGHGVTAGDKKQFYFLTADASRDADVAATGISTAELTEWIKPSNIKAQKRVLIFDACNSGQAINDLVKVGREDDKYIAARNDNNTLQLKAIDKLNERSGLFILSASASNQSAYEMGKLSQGLLTYALLKAMKEQPDILDDNKLLNLSKWFIAAEKTVEDVVRESGNRQEPQLISTSTFNIGIVDDEVIASIVVPQQKALFTASNFQNNDEAIADDDIEFSKHVNQALFEVSSRGLDSKISYVTVTQSPDAYTLGGRYIITGNDVTVRVTLRQNKTIKYRFEVHGTKDHLSDLASEVVMQATVWKTKQTQ
jgi:WD40 repeat protein/uncharacterized caspase-like protein